jgi:hypothetical protein
MICATARDRATAARLGGCRTGVLLAAARPPLDLGPLACIAFVPLFVRGAWASPRATPSSPVVYRVAAVVDVYFSGCDRAVRRYPLVVLGGRGAVVSSTGATSRAFVVAAVWVLAEAVIRGDRWAGSPGAKSGTPSTTSCGPGARERRRRARVVLCGRSAASSPGILRVRPEADRARLGVSRRQSWKSSLPLIDPSDRNRPRPTRCVTSARTTTRTAISP